MDENDGFVRPLTIEEIEQSWAEDEQGEAPPAPPMANVGLALELCSGANAERTFTLRGTDYRLRPTPYTTALRIQAWAQALERFEAMGRADPNLLMEHLPELRECYFELAQLGGSLVIGSTENPFLEADPPDYHRLIAVALDSGDEVPIQQPRSGQSLRRYNSAHYLIAYLAHFGAIPGMVVLEEGRPAPTSWRHFVSCMVYLRRHEAQEALQIFGATADLEQRARESWIGEQAREMGQ
jgi:hypothetical protein